MSRNRKSAKSAGARFERQIADCLAHHVDDRIDRRVKRGNADRGDITGIRIHGQRVVLECKDVATMALPAWLRETETARGNDDALFGAVVHKKRGTSNPLDQYVTFTVRELVALLRAQRIEED